MMGDPASTSGNTNKMMATATTASVKKMKRSIPRGVRFKILPYVMSIFSRVGLQRLLPTLQCPVVPSAGLEPATKRLHCYGF